MFMRLFKSTWQLQGERHDAVGFIYSLQLFPLQLFYFVGLVIKQVQIL